MAWAKLHTDILGDPKLMRAARKGAKGLHLLPWLIAFAKEADDGGRLSIAGEPADPVDIAALVPNATAKQVAESIGSLKRIGVLILEEDGAVRLAAWEQRSGTKPSDAKDAIRARVYRHREQKRNADDATPGNALQHANGNAPEEKRGEKKRVRREKILPSGALAATPEPLVNGAGPHPPPAEFPAVPPPPEEAADSPLHPKGDSGRGGWPAQVAAAFAAKGVRVQPGHAGAALELAVQKYRPDRIVRAVQYFLEDAVTVHGVKPGFVTLNEFAKAPGFWVEQIMPAGTHL